MKQEIIYELELLAKDLVDLWIKQFNIQQVSEIVHNNYRNIVFGLLEDIHSHHSDYTSLISLIYSPNGTEEIQLIEIIFKNYLALRYVKQKFRYISLSSLFLKVKNYIKKAKSFIKNCFPVYSNKELCTTLKKITKYSAKDSFLAAGRLVMYHDLALKLNKIIKPNWKIIEFGGSNGIFQLILNIKKENYIIADNFPKVNVLNLTQFKEKSYNCVILDQVLEHVSDPAKAITEIYRLLKPNGIFVTTTPFLFRVHGVPRDYWRFTRDGLSILLSKYSKQIVCSWGNIDFVNQYNQKIIFLNIKDNISEMNFKNHPIYPLMIWSIATK